ncbi:MAG: peroxiredoxin [Crocinitomicaceae bacterium]|nr:peroxiredoxin [Crocinitomicaceae bacterium]
MTLVGRQFPSIKVNSINNLGEEKMIDINALAKEHKSKVLLFWYPKDFTFVCPTEIHAFQNRLQDFKDRNTMVIGASCDTNEVHFAWLNTAKDDGGIEGVEFPLIADTNRNLSEALGVLDSTNESWNEETDSPQREGDYVTYRATYLIDEEGQVFHEGINHMPLGRNVDEFLRLIDAFTHVQEKGEVCPANWTEGDDAMNADRAGVAEYLKNH